MVLHANEMEEMKGWIRKLDEDRMSDKEEFKVLLLDL